MTASAGVAGQPIRRLTFLQLISQPGFANDQPTNEMAKDIPIRRTAMYLLYEDLARAHMRDRLAEAEQMRPVVRLLKLKRAQRRADSAGRRVRRALAHVALVR